MSHAPQQSANSSALCHESRRSSDLVYRYRTSCSCAVCTAEPYHVAYENRRFRDRLPLHHQGFEPPEIGTRWGAFSREGYWNCGLPHSSFSPVTEWHAKDGDIWSQGIPTASVEKGWPSCKTCVYMLGAAENAVWERHHERTGSGLPVPHQPWRLLHRSGSLACRSDLTTMCVCIVQIDVQRWHSSEDFFPPSRPPLPSPQFNLKCYMINSVPAKQWTHTQSYDIAMSPPSFYDWTSCVIPHTVAQCKSVPVAARPETCVCGRSPAEIMGSNPTEGMGVCFLWVFCVEVSASGWLLIQRRPTDCGVSSWVWSWILDNEVLAHWGCCAMIKKCIATSVLPHTPWSHIPLPLLLLDLCVITSAQVCRYCRPEKGDGSCLRNADKCTIMHSVIAQWSPQLMLSGQSQSLLFLLLFQLWHRSSGLTNMQPMTVTRYSRTQYGDFSSTEDAHKLHLITFKSAHGKPIKPRVLQPSVRPLPCHWPHFSSVTCCQQITAGLLVNLITCVSWPALP